MQQQIYVTLRFFADDLIFFCGFNFFPFSHSSSLFCFFLESTKFFSLFASLTNDFMMIS